jgi:hypothetical protein
MITKDPRDSRSPKPGNRVVQLPTERRERVEQPKQEPRAYAELAITTNFSFLRGASHPQEFALAAALHGVAAVGIADRNTLAGVVRAYDAIEQIEGDKPKLLVGARLVFTDGTPDILAYPTDRAAYGRLCRLLTTGKLRAKKGDCILSFNDLLSGAKVCFSQWWHPTTSIRVTGNIAFGRSPATMDRTGCGLRFPCFGGGMTSAACESCAAWPEITAFHSLL